MEPLESRFVLSGLAGAAMLGDGGTADVPPPTTVDTTAAARVSAPDTADTVALADGVLRVPVAAAGSKVMVRQFIDYRARPVVEVETVDGWTSVSAHEVRRIEIDASAPDVRVSVGPLVTSPIQVANPQNVDLVLREDAMKTGHARMTADSLIKDVELPDFGMLRAANSDLVDNVMVAEGEGPGGSGTPTQSPPSITSFSNETQWGYQRFYGTVVDDKSVEGLTVRFGGIIDGHTTTVNADGTFELIIELPPGTTGTATAQTTDSDGLDSNVAVTSVN